jgi:hypothetical protein
MIIVRQQQWHTSGTSKMSSKNMRICPSWWGYTVHAMKAQWFGDVQASVAK